MLQSAALGSLLLLSILSSAVGISLPFENAGLGLDRRNNNQCARTVKKYGYCDAVTKCCQPGFGCNTCGEGNVGQTCVERRKDGCKSDHDCYKTQKCINNGHEKSFCAQLWVDDLPKPSEKKDKKKKKKSTPTYAYNSSSLAPSLAPSGLAPSSFIMGPPKATKAPAPKKSTPKKEDSKKVMSKKEGSDKDDGKHGSPAAPAIKKDMSPTKGPAPTPKTKDN